MTKGIARCPAARSGNAAPARSMPLARSPERWRVLRCKAAIVPYISLGRLGNMADAGRAVLSGLPCGSVSGPFRGPMSGAGTGLRGQMSKRGWWHAWGPEDQDGEDAQARCRRAACPVACPDVASCGASRGASRGSRRRPCSFRAHRASRPPVSAWAQSEPGRAEPGRAEPGRTGRAGPGFRRSRPIPPQATRASGRAETRPAILHPPSPGAMIPATRLRISGPRMSKRRMPSSRLAAHPAPANPRSPVPVPPTRNRPGPVLRHPDA